MRFSFLDFMTFVYRIKNRIEKIFYKLINTIQALICYSNLLPIQKAIEYLQYLNYNGHQSCIVSTINNEADGAIQLSVIIPTYNNARFLEKCIHSVIDQKIKYTFEIIIVNDGSEDNTCEILEQFQSDARIHVINQENRGFSGARNRGLDCANGKYISFLDSDDVLIPGSINALLDAAIKYDADIVEGNYRLIYTNGQQKNETSHGLQKVIHPLGVMEGYMCGKIYRNTLFNGIRLNKDYWFEDSLNAHILFYRALTCYLIPDYVYGYYQNPKSITSNAWKSAKCIDCLYITEQLIEDHIKMGFPVDQRYYEFFLRAVRLSYFRINRQSIKTKKAVFSVFCALHRRFFGNFHTEVARMKKLEQSLEEGAYRKCILCLEWN